MDAFELVHQENYRDILNEINDGLYIVDTDRRIIFWNKAAEKITGFLAKEVVGTHCYDNILIHVDSNGVNLCKGKCPLYASIIDCKNRDTEVFLHHKSGHRVPVSVRTAAYKNNKGKVIGGIELFSDISSQEVTKIKIKELKSLAFIDKLTQLPNRAFTEMELDAKFAEMNRIGQTFGVLFFDIDHFKSFNDKYGHDIGDLVLKTIAKTLSANARPYDSFGRWGGEEFFGILHNVSEKDLFNLAERYRVLIASSMVRQAGSFLKVTASIGATIANKNDDIKSVVGRADKLMYQSKKNGRNRVTID